MANQPVPNTVQVDVLFLLFGQRVENVYHVRWDGGVDAAALADTRDAFATWVAEEWMPPLSLNCQFIGLEVKNLSIEDGTMLAYTPPTTVTGSVDYMAEPGNVSFSISLRTGQSGRSYRGRKFVAGMPGNARTGNQVNSGFATAMVAALEELRNLLISINAVLVVVSRIQDTIELLVPITSEVLSVTIADYDIDSQRRRLTGRGT
jgi:hypothetical protein